MDEAIKQGVSFLMQARGVLCTYLMVLAGGLAGLIISIFSKVTDLPYLTAKLGMFFIGILFFVIIFNTLNNVTDEIRTYVYKKRGEKMSWVEITGLVFTFIFCILMFFAARVISKFASNPKDYEDYEPLVKKE